MNSSPRIVRKTEKRLQKEQAQFNQYIKQIEKLRTQIHTTDHNLQIAKLIYNVTIRPLIDKWVLLKLKRLRLLDELLRAEPDPTIDTKQVQYLVIEEATELADKYNNGEAQQIFDKHSFRSFDEMRRQSFTDLLQRTKILLQELAPEEKNTEERIISSAEPNTENTHVQTTVLLKKMYMKLIRTFHPDKNNHQQSLAESVTKKANEAYHKKSFYDMLTLDITYMNEERTDVTKMPKEELKLLNEGLANELKELAGLLQSVQNKYGAYFREKYNYTGSKLKTVFQQEKTTLTYRLQQMEYNWCVCGSEIKMKEFLINNNYSFPE